MPIPTAKTVADRFLQGQGHSRTAGEVRFIKDRGGDRNEWAWNTAPPTKREMPVEFGFNPRYLKPLAQTLRATLMALGHVTSANNSFVKIKSANISPDGNLGGRGYIQKITDMRRAYMNVVEALSALSDTLYDELKAPHWDTSAAPSNREREEVQEIMQDAEAIRQDPEDWAEDEEDEGVDNVGPRKQARLRTAASRVAGMYADQIVFRSTGVQ